MRRILGLGVLFTVACSTPAPAPAPAPQANSGNTCSSVWTTRRSFSCYADGFSALPLDQKDLIWHLAEAAIAGRDIFYDQVSADGLEMRDMLEAILTHATRSIRRRSPRFGGTRSCSGSTAGPTTT